MTSADVYLIDPTHGRRRLASRDIKTFVFGQFVLSHNPSLLMSSALQGLRNASVISYYFVKSDIKTIIFPIVILPDLFKPTTTATNRLPVRVCSVVGELELVTNQVRCHAVVDLA